MKQKGKLGTVGPLKKLKIFIPICLVLVLVWFLGVDRSWFVETCGDCYSSRDVIQYRFLTVPFSERVVEQESPISRVARDLGVPCPHRNLTRWQKERWWGLLFCCCPCKSGITSLTWDERLYDERTIAIIKSLVKSNPELPEEFYRRILVEHDLKYWEQFKEQVFSQQPTKSE